MVFAHTHTHKISARAETTEFPACFFFSFGPAPPLLCPILQKNLTITKETHARFLEGRKAGLTGQHLVAPTAPKGARFLKSSVFKNGPPWGGGSCKKAEGLFCFEPIISPGPN